MITKRIIPCLDVKDGRVVKGVNFAGLQDVSSPVELAEYYTRSRADELVFTTSPPPPRGGACFPTFCAGRPAGCSFPSPWGGHQYPGGF